ncbi:MAG: hypothetical protein IJ757_06330 [Clostridiales bacterium]|nr:hypothetical protein [Clostridiales bacterium]
MTNEELKKALRRAYEIDSTTRGKAFVKAHEQRRINLTRIVAMETTSFGVEGVIAALVTALIGTLLSLHNNNEFIWVMASLMPVTALLVMTGLRKSERYGMQELEMVTRFSVRFQRCVRLFVAGFLGAVTLAVTAPVMVLHTSFDPVQTISLLAVPYLLTSWEHMLITRRIHGNESIYACLAVAIITGAMPMIVAAVADASRQIMVRQICEFIALPLLLAVFIEGYLYVKGSMNETWNLY